MACRGRKPSRHRNECNSCVGVFFRAQPELVAPLAAALDHPDRYGAYDPGRRAGLGREALAGALPAKCLSTQLAEAAQSEKDLLEICVSLRLVLALEGVECLMK